MKMILRPLFALSVVAAVSGLAYSQRVITAAPAPPQPVVYPPSEDTTPIPDNFPRFHVIAIGKGTEPGGLSDTGYVTGTMDNSKGGKRAFLWKDGTLTDLGTLFGDESYGRAVNDAGEVVGTSTAIHKTLEDGTPQHGHHGFLYRNGKMTDISGTDPDTSDPYDWKPFDINNRGMVVGQITKHGIGSPAVSWQRGKLTPIGTLGGFMATAFACSDRGGIVGASYVAGNNEPRTGEESAFLFRTGRMTELGTLGGTSSTALDVNNVGDVVGFSGMFPQIVEPNHAFLVRRGKMTDLGTFGGKNSSANGINDAGQIVGCAQTKSGTVYFLQQDGVKVDLQRLVSRASGWNLVPSTGLSFGTLGVISINNRGQILCQARKAEEGGGAVLLHPVAPGNGAAAP